MSSKRHSRRRSCEAKIRHITRAQAEAAAVRTGLGLSVYGCDFCHGYHVGRAPQPNLRTVGGGSVWRPGGKGA